MPDFTSLKQRYPSAINIRAWDLGAGDAVAFAGTTVHSSGPNESRDRRRLAYSIRMLAEDVIWDPRPNTPMRPEWEILTPGRPVNAVFPVIWERQ